MSIDRLPDTVPELLRWRALLSPSIVASHQQVSSDTWLATHWADHFQEIQRVAGAFRQLGLEKGDRLAIFARSRREWHIAEMAGLLSGAVIVGVDTQASAEQIQFLLDHAGVSCLVADSLSKLAHIREEALAGLKFAITLDAPAEGVQVPNHVIAWNALGALPANSGSIPVDVHPDDPATLIYTAGTTGDSKGIEYSHRKIMAGCKSLALAYSKLAEGEACICWLPMAHLYQRMMNLLAVTHGLSIYFAEKPHEVLSVAALSQPVLFCAVPRFYEKLAETVRQSTDSQAALRSIIGNKIRYAITGAAPIPLWVHECLLAAGLPLIEAYGVSENPVPIATNLPHAFRPGAVGKPFPANEIRLDEDGEILVRGPALFSGYYRDGQTRDCFTEDGYYKTGDLGRFDEDGFLFLEGRKAEIIKTSTGRRISPTRIEAIYGESPYLDRIVVFGNGRKHLVALVNLQIDAITESLGELPSGDLGQHPKVRELLDQALKSLGERLAPYERINAYGLFPEPLSVDKGELTATLKLRRKQIESRHAGLIEELYCHEQPPLAS